MAETKNPKTKSPVKMQLKLRRPHPANTMKLGRHSITNVFAGYALNESEVKELQAKGGKHWFISKEDFEKEQAAKKSKKDSE